MGVYKKEFIDRVKRVYSGCTDIIKAAETGNTFLGRYLDDNCHETITSSDALNLSEKELKKKALRIKQRQQLYSDWHSGKAYTIEGLKNRDCPLSYTQNADYKLKDTVECTICRKRGANYVCFFPSCKFWEDKGECWKLYKQIQKI